jgi:tetratricopeptide (TPR) repeat protein
MLISIVMAVSLNALASQQFQAGNFEQAEQTCRMALEYGMDDPATAMILGNLASTELALGRYEVAEGLANQAIALLDRTAGPSSVLLVPSLNTLSSVYIETQRYAEAVALLKRAVRLGSRDAGAHYATSLHNLGAVYHLTGRLDRAAKLYDQALRIRLRLFGPDDPLTRATSRNIGALDQASTKLARAAKSKPENSLR